MKQVAFGLAATAVLCFAADQAFAQPGVSHQAAIQIAAGHAMPGAIDGAGVHQFQQVGYYHRGYPGYAGYHRYHGGYGPAFAYPRAWRHPTVVIPAPRLVPMVPPPIYRGPAYYYGPQYGFGYRSPGFSFGFSF
jgi:hypothetical protein